MNSFSTWFFSAFWRMLASCFAVVLSYFAVVQESSENNDSFSLVTDSNWAVSSLYLAVAVSRPADKVSFLSCNLSIVASRRLDLAINSSFSAYKRALYSLDWCRLATTASCSDFDDAKATTRSFSNARRVPPRSSSRIMTFSLSSWICSAKEDSRLLKLELSSWCVFEAMTASSFDLDKSTESVDTVEVSAAIVSSSCLTCCWRDASRRLELCIWLSRLFEVVSASFLALAKSSESADNLASRIQTSSSRATSLWQKSFRSLSNAFSDISTSSLALAKSASRLRECSKRNSSLRLSASTAFSRSTNLSLDEVNDSVRTVTCSSFCWSLASSPNILARSSSFALCEVDLKESYSRLRLLFSLNAMFNAVACSSRDDLTSESSDCKSWM